MEAVPSAACLQRQCRDADGGSRRRLRHRRPPSRARPQGDLLPLRLRGPRARDRLHRLGQDPPDRAAEHLRARRARRVDGDPGSQRRALPHHLRAPQSQGLPRRHDRPARSLALRPVVAAGPDRRPDLVGRDRARRGHGARARQDDRLGAARRARRQRGVLERQRRGDHRGHGAPDRQRAEGHRPALAQHVQRLPGARNVRQGANRDACRQHAARDDLSRSRRSSRVWTTGTRPRSPTSPRASPPATRRRACTRRPPTR